jgi:hypothetical protein
MLSNIVHMSVLFYHRSWISYDMLAEVVLYLKKIRYEIIVIVLIFVRVISRWSTLTVKL